VDWGTIIDNSLTAAIGLQAVVYALAAIGLNVHFGYTGLLNFGQVGFMAVGAYGLGVSVTYFDWPLWVAVLAGVGASVVLALLLGLPTLRLRADYLAIVTIAASEIIRFVVRSPTYREWSGGSSGLSGFARDFYRLNPFPTGRRYGVWFIDLSPRVFWVLFVGWLLVVIFTLMVFLLMRSPWGRVVKSIREDEDAARSLGKNVYGYKMQALIFGGIIGAFAGMVNALGTAAIQPDTFAPPVTFFAYVALILGGTARVLGPVIGSMIFWTLLAFVDNTLRQALRQGYIPDWLLNANQIGQVRFMVVGIALMLLMVYRPQGIFGDRREISLEAR
jgi:neutral amino acid transport system permease protein